MYVRAGCRADCRTQRVRGVLCYLPVSLFGQPAGRIPGSGFVCWTVARALAVPRLWIVSAVKSHQGGSTFLLLVVFSACITFVDLEAVQTDVRRHWWCIQPAACITAGTCGPGFWGQHTAGMGLGSTHNGMCGGLRSGQDLGIVGPAAPTGAFHACHASSAGGSCPARQPTTHYCFVFTTQDGLCPCHASPSVRLCRPSQCFAGCWVQLG
jgi:hypothetical protein